jgi:hypothetical protein
MDVDWKREADWPHWPGRDGQPAGRERFERRLFRDSELDAELERTQATIRQLEAAAAAKAVEVEELEHAVGKTYGHAPSATHLVFLWTPHGYGLDVADGPAPRVGARVPVDGVERLVAKLGPSPLPGDERRCAYLEP